MVPAPFQTDRSVHGWPLVHEPATGSVVLQMASTPPKVNSETKRRRGGRALRSSASRNGPFRLCHVESFGNSFLARIIHEHFCCNRQSAATTSPRPTGS